MNEAGNNRNEKLTIIYEPKVVRVNNDDTLKSFFKNGKRKASFKLAGEILKEYERKFGEPLDIKRHSLSTELYDHYLLMIISEKIEKAFGKTKPTQWMIRHMEVIDCGEKAVDNNRFLWDLLSFYR